MTVCVKFVAAGDLARFTGRSVPKIAYNPPDDALIERTLSAWEALTDRDLFLAIGHELSFGLRIAEFSQARWNWHTEKHGYPVLDGQASVKNGTGFIQVRALDPWFSATKRLATERGWWPATLTDALIISGSDTYRKDGLFRSVSAWMRKQGWATKKTNHALRAFAGGQVAMKYDIYQAQMFLRHSTVKVTEQHYTHFVKTFRPEHLESLSVCWAT